MQTISLNNITIIGKRIVKGFMNSSVNRTLIFQGGGSLGTYEAGAYKAIKEELSQYSSKRDRKRANIPYEESVQCHEFHKVPV